jgi:putative heme-binding domain-containing protein
LKNSEIRMPKSEGNPKLEVRRPGRGASVVIWLVCLSFSAFAQSDPSVAVEAITRLENIDLEQNAKIKETVFKLLERTRGTPDFLKLVKHFKIKGQEPALLDLAIAHPAEEFGVEAMRMVLSGPERTLIEEKLRGNDGKAATAVAEALGASGSKDAVKLLLPVVRDEKAEAGLRKQAVRSLARTEEGAGAVLQLARENQLAEALRFTASAELSKVRWQNIKTEAAKLLPLPEGQNSQPLPPLSELLKRTGNIANGERVFRSQTAACASCHKVKGHGMEVGPDLSEIGTKLGKEALYESILDPSAGISFGYEAWQLELKNGDEAYGLIASETADEIAIKSNMGIVTRYKKSEVKSRQQMKLSIMPTGLQQAMSATELVDLIEYLAGLKKAP